MTGPYESILGRRIDRVLETTLTFNPTHFEVATGDVRLSGTIIDAIPATGHATSIRRLMVTEAEAEELAKLAAQRSTAATSLTDTLPSPLAGEGPGVRG